MDSEYLFISDPFSNYNNSYETKYILTFKVAYINMHKYSISQTAMKSASKFSVKAVFGRIFS